MSSESSDELVDLSAYLGLEKELPISNSELNELGRIVDRRVFGSFYANNPKFASGDSSWNDEDWDEFIFNSIQHFGAIAILSHRFVRRLYDWQRQSRGPERLRRLGHELAAAVEVRRGLAKGTITLKHVWYKEKILPQLITLQQRLSEEWPEPVSEVMAFIRNELEDGTLYPDLHRNLSSFLDFLNQDHSTALAFRGPAPGTRGKRIGPARMVDRWFARSENLDPEYVRQRMSELKAKAGRTVKSGEDMIPPPL